MEPHHDDMHGWIHVSLGKGCILRLPLMQYAAALKAGKAWQRRQQHAARAHALGVQREADLLAWIDNEAP